MIKLWQLPVPRGLIYVRQTTKCRKRCINFYLLHSFALKYTAVCVNERYFLVKRKFNQTFFIILWGRISEIFQV